MDQNRLENIRFEISQSKDELEYRVINVEVKDENTVHRHQMQLSYNAFISDFEQIMNLITNQLKSMIKTNKDKEDKVIEDKKIYLKSYKIKNKGNIQLNKDFNQRMINYKLQKEQETEEDNLKTILDL